MWIKFKAGVSGPRFTYLPWEKVDHPDAAEALRWIDRGIAEAAQPAASEPEAAIQPDAPERAVSRRRGARLKPH